MTYEEAIEAMKSGHKVRNENFTSDEFFEMKDGKNSQSHTTVFG